MDPITRSKNELARIQALENDETNPLTGLTWPEGHAEIQTVRCELPVYRNFEKIIFTVFNGQVFIVSSETGSGKSTQLPQLLALMMLSTGLKVACTQPRRIATTSLARRVAEEMGVVMGEEVGYQISGDQRINKNGKKTKLVYLTEGSLLARQNRQKFFEEYSYHHR